MSLHDRLASIIDDAERSGDAVEQLSVAHPDLDARTAYGIQNKVLQRRLARGERRVGIKLGLTSRAKMLQVNVNELIVGTLTDAMEVEEGGKIALDGLIHPRIEPEIAFILGTGLSGSADLCAAAAAVKAVAPAMEIIDSRYVDFKFNLADVVADNCSSARFVIGAPSPLDGDIANLGLVMTENGRVVTAGSTAAILGHPLRALIQAAQLCARVGVEMQAGDIVLAGAATAAVEMHTGSHYAVEVARLGRVGISTT